MPWLGRRGKAPVLRAVRLRATNILTRVSGARFRERRSPEIHPRECASRLPAFRARLLRRARDACPAELLLLLQSAESRARLRLRDSPCALASGSDRVVIRAEDRFRDARLGSAWRSPGTAAAVR